MDSGSGWNLWVWLLDVVARRYMYIDFLILLIPTPLVRISYFLQQHPYFYSFKKKKNLFLFQYFFVIKFYVLNIFFAQYKHTYRQLRASDGSHMKAAHILYMKKHTQANASYPVMDISCMTSRKMV